MHVLTWKTISAGLYESQMEDKTSEGSSGKSETEVNSCDKLVMNRLKASLCGIPPPPSVVLPQQKIDDILDTWKTFSEIPNDSNSDSRSKFVGKGR